MTEAFLHYLWQYRLFDCHGLKADDGSFVEIDKPGVYNTGSGPDFFNARIKINGVQWAGNVEIHIRSSDWNKHQHQTDPVYDSCMLHVVLENDCPTVRMNGSVIPTIQLKDRYPDHLWSNYLQLIGRHSPVSCKDSIYKVEESLIRSQFILMTEERLNSKAEMVRITAQGLKNDWEECFYQLLAKSFGFHVNALPFEILARSVPFKILQREKNGPTATEAILFGQAGMLEKEHEHPYYLDLKREYLFYKNKYNLSSIQESYWKYMRLRPVNFPTIRIAQLADLIFRTGTIFSIVLEATDDSQLMQLLDCTASFFWNDHYTFQTTSPHFVKKVGKDAIRTIMINTIAPVYKAWALYTGQPSFSEKAIELLDQLPPENNVMVRNWKGMGVKVSSAADSQAVLQLQTLYCAEKKCLSCNIGNHVITSHS